ncbi:Tetratricopeptide repeat protein 1 [Cyphellophora attinorum]|uniref:Tetratricopeptide repeat protein 1 n=1 Tax=Cyphellophora attinorum TaxID=1664694 RepID=A0A0N1NYH0_9EURO|nr:Tetratricopeptide repeat protein 1 [Phialophora attinorum]KPI36025.1 Tetratricopeptide repeat protein 1 [Phialophora attinorum]
MSFKATGPKTRPDRVKPIPPIPSPLPSGWTASTNYNTTSHRHRSTSNASTDSTTSFHSATSQHDNFHDPAEADPAPSANAEFAKADYSSAISTYDKALAELPTYLDYELAVLQSNIAACHLKLEQWKEALDACEAGLNGLERELPTKKLSATKNKEGKNGPQPNGAKSSSDLSGTDDAEFNGTPQVNSPTNSNNSTSPTARRQSITRIRIKLLLRRARARSSLTPQSWSHLAGALEDYKTLATEPSYLSQLPPSDLATVRKALVELPPKVNEAKDREVGEMMGKLKELGNGILKPFGLSTDMFKMTQDPASGGWSMNFDQGGGAATQRK